MIYAEEDIDELPTRVYVTNKCCQECFLFPRIPITDEQRQAVIAMTLEGDHIPECLSITIARRVGGYLIPRNGFVCCFGFYYRYLGESKILKKAQESGTVHFMDITGYPTLKSTGLVLDGSNPPWRPTPVALRVVDQVVEPG